MFLCSRHALPPHLPTSIASESLPFFGTRRVSWLTSNCPRHVTAVPCCAFLGRGSISSDRERLLRFACLPHAGGVCWQDLHRVPKHSPWPAWSSFLCLRGRGPSSFPGLTAVWNLSLGKACLLPSYREGIPKAPESHFLLKSVNGMSQPRSAGGRLLASSRGFCQQPMCSLVRQAEAQVSLLKEGVSAEREQAG